MRDVFISYPSENKAIADAVCHYLEQNAIKCWYAPRDIKAGTAWEEAIMDAISSSKVFILIFSENANQSKHVISEVREAFNAQCTIIPFRVDDSRMSRTLSYYLDGIHWLDAVDPPLEANIEMLCRQVASIIDTPLQINELSKDTQKSDITQKLHHNASPTHNGKGYLTLICVVLSVLLLISVFFPRLTSTQNNSIDSPESQTTNSDTVLTQEQTSSNATEPPQTQTTGMNQDDDDSCWKCQGTGICSRCSGTAVCYYCEASGKDCYSCGGTGYCYNCSGSGKCHYCQGTGILK